MTAPTNRRDLFLLASAAFASFGIGLAMRREPQGATTPMVVPFATPSAEFEPATPIPATAMPTRYGSAFSFVAEHEGSLHIVLAAEVDEGWASGRAIAVDDTTVQRSVDRTKLPASVSAQVGTKVDVYGSDGRICSAVVGEPLIAAAAIGYGDDLELTDDGIGPSELASWVWDVGQRRLLAPLQGEEPCRSAQFARAAELPPPIYYEALAHPTSDQVRAARRAWLETPEIQQARIEFDESMRAMAQDVPVPKIQHRIRSTAWSRPNEPVTLVSVELDGPEFGPCGGLTRQWGIAVVQDDGTRIERIAQGEGDRLAVLFDLEDDGQPEALLVPGEFYLDFRLLSLSPAGWSEVAHMDQLPLLGCPC